jgi:lysophospholipase L1-like esterase
LELHEKILSHKNEAEFFDVLGEATPSGNLSNTIETINASVSGLNSTELLQTYETTWRKYLDPDMIVINLSNNDKDQKKIFENNLREFAKIYSKSNVQIVFILEANSSEYSHDVDGARGAMKEVAHSMNIPIIDLHTFLLSQNNQGIEWWDSVHPTEFGHSIAGRYVADCLLNILLEKGR